ncbi:MAG: sigma-54 interaction domain-containing protein [Pseudomonadales bacterium]
MSTLQLHKTKQDKELTIVGEHCDPLVSALNVLEQPHRRIGNLMHLHPVHVDITNREANVIIIVANAHLSEAIGLLSWIRQNSPRSGVVVVANHSTTWFKRATLEMGALDFINFSHCENQQQLTVRLQQALAHYRASEQPDDEQSEFEVDGVKVIGSSSVMSSVFARVNSASRSHASVFITGENGTGKDVCASMIHAQSVRSEHRLMSVNCAAIPQGLAESELFGHVKGSFTGAISDRLGVAKMADNGTLFLDEIAEMDLSIQGKLLRFLQSGTFSQVGSSQTESVDARVICATNRDPEQAIEQGRFREDLFYRLNVIHIHLPPLRERGEDILKFANRFMLDFSEQEDKTFQAISPEAGNLLVNYRWPGNVRELQNVIQSIVVLNEGELLTPSMLPLGIIKPPTDIRPNSRKQSDSVYSLPALKAGAKYLLDTANAKKMDKPELTEILPLDDVIQNAISVAIAQCDGNVVEASLKLGVSASTLYRRLKV